MNPSTSFWPPHVVVGALEVQGKRLTLRSGKTTIGRGGTCGVTIPHPSVALHQATIECGDHPDNVFIYSVGGGSDTILWRCKLRPLVRYHLQDKSQVTFGEVNATFHAAGLNEPPSYAPPITPSPDFVPPRSFGGLRTPPDDVFEQATQLNISTSLSDTPRRTSPHRNGTSPPPQFNPFEETTQVPQCVNGPRSRHLAGHLSPAMHPPQVARRSVGGETLAPNLSNGWESVFLEETQVCQTESHAVTDPPAGSAEAEQAPVGTNMPPDDTVVPTDNESLLDDGADGIFVCLPSPNPPATSNPGAAAGQAPGVAAVPTRTSACLDHTYSLLWNKSGEDALTAVPSPALGNNAVEITINSDDEMIGSSQPVDSRPSQPVDSPPTADVTPQHCLMKSILLSKGDKGGGVVLSVGSVASSASTSDARHSPRHVAASSDSDVTECYEFEETFESQSKFVSRTQRPVSDEGRAEQSGPAVVEETMIADSEDDGDRTDSDVGEELLFPVPEAAAALAPLETCPVVRDDAVEDSQSLLLVDDAPESPVADVEMDTQDAYQLLTQVDEQFASQKRCEVPAVAENTQVLTQSPPRDFRRFEPSASDAWMITGACTQSPSAVRRPVPPASLRVPAEPPSTNLPSTSDNSQADKMNEDDDLPLTQMTQQTQEFERLSLEMPATQDFHEQMVTEALESVWQSDNGDEEATFKGFSEVEPPRRPNGPLTKGKPAGNRIKILNNENGRILEEKVQAGSSGRPKRSRKPTWKVESSENSASSGTKSSTKRGTKCGKPAPVASKQNGHSEDETDSDVEQQLESMNQSSGSTNTPKSVRGKSKRIKGKPKAKRRRGICRMVSSSSSDSDSTTCDVRANAPSIDGSTMSSVACPDSGEETPSDVEESVAQVASLGTLPAASHRVVSTADWLTESEEIRFTGVATRTRASNVLPKLLRQRNTKSMNVAFTGGIRPAHRNAVHELGGSVADMEDADVLICDQVRRTVKLLSAVASGIPVVPSKWLTDCQKAKCWLGTDGHILRDKDAEARWHFRLDESLRQARVSKLLAGYNVAVSNNVKPPPQDVFRICELSGAVCVPTPARVWPANTLLISCPADKSVWPTLEGRNVKVVSVEIILSGVLQQKLDLNSYLLQS